MKFQRPVVPSRFFELIWLGLAFLTALSAALLMAWFATMGKIEWAEVPALMLGPSPIAVLSLLFWYLNRRSRLRAQAELVNYERICAAIIDQNSTTEFLH